MQIKNLLTGFLLVLTINQISYANNNCPKWFPMPALDGLAVVIPIYNVNITGPDLDCDGIIDTQDNDIDGDGVANASDVFPLNSSESVDTDGDGIGNNADTDDDNDGYSDAAEIVAGSDPLDVNDTPLNYEANFPLGTYGLVPDRPNFTHQVHINSNMNTGDIKHILQKARDGGFKVYQYISADVLYYPLEEIKKNWVENVIQYSHEYGDVLAGFYLPEELGVDAIVRLKELRNMIHELAPDLPAITYMGYYEDHSFEENPDLGRAVDANVMGTYPIDKGESIALMTGVMAMGRQYVKSVGSKVYGTPSTWNKILDLPDAPLRVRSMFTQALIGGAEGILFFDATGFDATKYPALNADLDRMQDELTRGHLASILLAPETNTERLQVSIQHGPTNEILFTRYFSTVRSFNRIQTRLKVKGNTLYLFAANIGGYDENASGEYDGNRTPDTDPSTNGTLTVEFSQLPTDAVSLVALSESTSKDAVGNRLRAEVGTDRAIAMHNGAFTDTFGPYETHVYKIEGELPAGFVLDMDDPTVYMSNYVNSKTVTIKGVVYPSSPVTVNGVQATINGNRYEANITLAEGESRTISISSSDHTITRTVGVDATKPDTHNLTKTSQGNVFPLTFTWEGSDNLSGADFYSYRINGDKWSLWRTRPYVTITREEWEKLGYSMGNAVIEVRTRDAAFNIDTTPVRLPFTISNNRPPNNLSISGPSLGDVGVSYSFEINATDPENDDVSYSVVWDDGTQSTWSNFGSQSQIISHTFAYAGDHIIKVLARDTAGNETLWTDSPFHLIGIKGALTRAFPFGFYGAEEYLDRVTKYSPRVYIDSAMQPDDINITIERVANHGLKVYQYLSQTVVPLERHVLQERWIRPAMAVGDATGALAGYYPAEEFSTNAIPNYLKLINTVHATDSKHRPVVTYIGAYGSWEFEERPELAKTVDINILGAYPLYKGQSMALMTGIMELGKKYFTAVGTKVYAAVETFGGDSLGAKGDALNVPDAPLRVRNSTYQALIGGALGFVNYDSTGYDEVKFPQLSQELDRIADEITGAGNLGVVILQPDALQEVNTTIIEGPNNKIVIDNYFTNVEEFNRVQTHMEVYQGNIYLFVANVGGYDEDQTTGKYSSRIPNTNTTTNGALTVQFSNLPTQASSGLVALSETETKDNVGNYIKEAVGTNRSIAISAGAFTDTLGPYETHVYRVPMN